MNKRILALLLSLMLLLGSLFGCELFEEKRTDLFDDYSDSRETKESQESTENKDVYGFASVEGIPDYSGKAYVELNGNVPERIF